MDFDIFCNVTMSKSHPEVNDQVSLADKFLKSLNPTLSYKGAENSEDDIAARVHAPYAAFYAGE